MTSPLREKLAGFVAGDALASLPGEITHQAKRCLLDFLGVALGADGMGLIPIVTQLMEQSGGKPEASLIGSRQKMPALQAALVNGVKGHALDMDDGHRLAAAHPAVVVFPAALALAEREDAAGARLIEAAVAGYETLIYLARAANPAHLRKGFHTTSTLGACGAAAACARLLGLDQQQTAEAISIAGLCAGGLLEVMSSGQMMKPMQTARASQAGLLAALLAQGGASGPEEIFEGRLGFFKAYVGQEPGREALDGLGEIFEIGRVYFKRYAACRHVHPALDAVLEITARQNIEPAEVQRIEVETYQAAYDMTGLNTRADTHLAAKFSLPVSVALCLIHGGAGLAEYSPACLANSAVARLAEKVEVRVSEDKESAYPVHRGARVNIHTARGSGQCDLQLPLGEPENPFSDAILADKFERNAAQVLEVGRARELREAIFSLEQIPVRELMALAHE